MQEDKESVFDALETVEKCLTVFTPMVKTMTVLKENMYNACKNGFINATDLADYVTKKGVPFRKAYQITGQIVGYCVENNLTLEEIPLEKYKEYCLEFDGGLYEAINLKTCVEKRISEGGTGLKSVEKQIEDIKAYLKQ